MHERSWKRTSRSVGSRVPSLASTVTLTGRAAGWIVGGILLMACGDRGPGALEGARGAGAPAGTVAAGRAPAGTAAVPAGPQAQNVTTTPHAPRVPAVIPLSDEELRRGARVEVRPRGAAAEVVVRLPARPRSYGYDPVLTVGDRTLTEYRYEDGDRTIVFKGAPADEAAGPSLGTVAPPARSSFAMAPTDAAANPAAANPAGANPAGANPAAARTGSPVTLSFRGGHDVVRRLDLGTLELGALR